MVGGSKRTKKISAKMKKQGSKEIKLNIQDIKERSYRSRLTFQYTVKSSDKYLLKYWNDTGDKKSKKKSEKKSYYPRIFSRNQDQQNRNYWKCFHSQFSTIP